LPEGSANEQENQISKYFIMGSGGRDNRVFLRQAHRYTTGCLEDIDING
jgi:hypothetical protein